MSRIQKHSTSVLQNKKGGTTIRSNTRRNVEGNDKRIVIIRKGGKSKISKKGSKNETRDNDKRKYSHKYYYSSYTSDSDIIYDIDDFTSSSYSSTDGYEDSISSGRIERGSFSSRCRHEKTSGSSSHRKSHTRKNDGETSHDRYNSRRKGRRKEGRSRRKQRGRIPSGRRTSRRSPKRPTRRKPSRTKDKKKPPRIKSKINGVHNFSDKKNNGKKQSSKRSVFVEAKASSFDGETSRFWERVKDIGPEGPFDKKDDKNSLRSPYGKMEPKKNEKEKSRPLSMLLDTKDVSNVIKQNAPFNTKEKHEEIPHLNLSEIYKIQEKKKEQKLSKKKKKAPINVSSLLSTSISNTESLENTSVKTKEENKEEQQYPPQPSYSGIKPDTCDDSDKSHTKQLFQYEGLSKAEISHKESHRKAKLQRMSAMNMGSGGVFTIPLSNNEMLTGCNLFVDAIENHGNICVTKDSLKIPYLCTKDLFRVLSNCDLHTGLRVDNPHEISSIIRDTKKVYNEHLSDFIDLASDKTNGDNINIQEFIVTSTTSYSSSSSSSRTSSFFDTGNRKKGKNNKRKNKKKKKKITRKKYNNNINKKKSHKVDFSENTLLYEDKGQCNVPECLKDVSIILYNSRMSPNRSANLEEGTPLMKCGDVFEVLFMNASSHGQSFLSSVTVCISQHVIDEDLLRIMKKIFSIAATDFRSMRDVPEERRVPIPNGCIVPYRHCWYYDQTERLSYQLTQMTKAYRRMHIFLEGSIKHYKDIVKILSEANGKNDRLIKEVGDATVSFQIMDYKRQNAEDNLKRAEDDLDKCIEENKLLIEKCKDLT